MGKYNKNSNKSLILKACFFAICFFLIPMLTYGEISNTLEIVTYYPSPNIDARDLTVNHDLEVNRGVVIINNGSFTVGSNIFKVDANGLNCQGVTYGQETFNYPLNPTGNQGNLTAANITLTDIGSSDSYIELRGIALTSPPALVNTNDSNINYTSSAIVPNFETRQDSCAPQMSTSCLGTINGGSRLRGDAMTAFRSVTYAGGGGDRLSRRKGLRSITKTGSDITAALGACYPGGGWGVGGGLALDRRIASFTKRYRTFRYELK